MLPSGGKSDDKIKINAPIKIVNRLMTCVIVTSPTFWLKEVNGRHPKQPESALENPSTASDPCNSSILISRSKAPVHTALVAPVVSAADTRNTIAIVKMPQIKDWFMAGQKDQLRQTEDSNFLYSLCNSGKVYHRRNTCNRKNDRQQISKNQSYQDIQILIYPFQ